MTPSEAKAEAFLTALRALPKKERQAVLARIAQHCRALFRTTHVVRARRCRAPTRRRPAGRSTNWLRWGWLSHVDTQLP